MVAHRGGGEDGVSENALSAFRAAIDAGADVLETDVQWTAPTAEEPNGVPVLMHDATINRTARCRA
jgi:glycerophosphoryl diester phosphodiesterase